MDRIRWSEKSIPFRNLVDNPSIPKPALVQMGGKAIIVGEKINGEFIMASPCKVFGDRFDVMEQEIVLSSKHTGVWRVISKAMSKKEGHIHRLTTRDIERIHEQDVRNERLTPRSYICIRPIEAFDLVIRNNDPSMASGTRIERRMKQIEEDVEFEIFDAGEVEYTPSEGERTSQDYIMVPRKKQGTFLQLLLPGIVQEEQTLRNRVLRVLHCSTKGETRQRHFLLEVNEQPCEIRPVASEGSTELRYLHSTQNLYDYMSTYGNDTTLYVKLLRGDPPIKAIEFDGYMVLKCTLNGDKIPICRVEDLEITLVSPDFPVKVRLPTRNDHQWRSLSEIRAAEIQCMQLALALLARHESEMYVTFGAEKTTANYIQSYANDEDRRQKSRDTYDVRKKHLEECQKVFGTDTRGKINDDMYPYQATEKQFRSLTGSGRKSIQKQQSMTYDDSRRNIREEPMRIPRQPTISSGDSRASSRQDPIRVPKQQSVHIASDKLYRSADRELSYDQRIEQEDSSNRPRRSIAQTNSIATSSGHYKTKTNMN